MKSNFLPKIALSATVALSISCFVFINTRTGLADAAIRAQHEPLIEQAMQPTENQPEEREIRLPDVAALGRLLGLVGQILPLGN